MRNLPIHIYSMCTIASMLLLFTRSSANVRSHAVVSKRLRFDPFTLKHIYIYVTDVAMPVRAVCKPHSPDLKKRRSSD